MTSRALESSRPTRRSQSSTSGREAPCSARPDSDPARGTAANPARPHGPQCSTRVTLQTISFRALSAPPRAPRDHVRRQSRRIAGQLAHAAPYGAYATGQNWASPVMFFRDNFEIRAAPLLYMLMTLHLRVRITADVRTTH